MQLHARTVDLVGPIYCSHLSFCWVGNGNCIPFLDDSAGMLLLVSCCSCKSPTTTVVVVQVFTLQHHRTSSSRASAVAYQPKDFSKAGRTSIQVTSSSSSYAKPPCREKTLLEMKGRSQGQCQDCNDRQRLHC